jgi:hypothetical protein
VVGRPEDGEVDLRNVDASGTERTVLTEPFGLHGLSKRLTWDLESGYTFSFDLLPSDDGRALAWGCGSCRRDGERVVYADSGGVVSVRTDGSGALRPFPDLPVLVPVFGFVAGGHLALVEPHAVYLARPGGAPAVLWQEREGDNLVGLRFPEQGEPPGVI